MGTSIHRCGGIGAGQAMKALNNLVSAGGFLIGIEALLVGQNFGLDAGADGGHPQRVDRHEQQHPGEVQAVRAVGLALDVGFALDLMVKDLGIALEVADDLHVNAPFATLCKTIWAAAQADLGTGPRPHRTRPLRREDRRRSAELNPPDPETDMKRPLVRIAAVGLLLGPPGRRRARLRAGAPVSRPITMIVPFPPAGSTDLLGRVLADSMRKILKQSVVVENLGGAGGTIGAAKAAKSRNDGYTFLFVQHGARFGARALPRASLRPRSGLRAHWRS